MTKTDVEKFHEFVKYNNEFKRTFGTTLHQFVIIIGPFVCGFDIVKFNEYVHCPDNISLKDFIAEKYDNDAVELISKLIEI